MGDLGKLLPHASGETNLQEWRVPILVSDYVTGTTYKTANIYESEGYLCIDIGVTKENDDEQS